MQYVSFGRTGMQVSRFCLGGMMFSRKLDLDQSRQVVDEALDQGVNFIDTAESYGDSEEFLGNILASRRDKVYLATKVYTKRATDGRCGRNSRVNIINSLERSLKLLQTDYIDLYQLHHPDTETPPEETLSTLDLIIRQGKVRYVGVTNHYAWQMAAMIGQAKLHGFAPIVSIQCSYSIVDRPAEMETVPMAQRFNLALMAYYPLRAGVLTGKYKSPTDIPADSRAQQDPKVQRLLKHPKLFDVLDAVKTVGEKHQLKMNQVAMLWLLSKPWVTTPILGGSHPDHFRDTYAIAGRALPPEDLQRIDEVSHDFVYKPFVNQPVEAGPSLTEQW
ncbi:MAG TPA: aldo/keto reductase [Tepidisphaeraceae bacterium]|jgi:aryl-alcohol dehydrogenase-like predicted oxidoreductase